MDRQILWPRPKDIDILTDPEKQIREPGGRIYLATREDHIVGCCALIVNGPGSYELVKMAVREEFRNQGIGKALLAHVIEAAGDAGFHKLRLETNRKLSAAIHVYESLGFQQVEASMVEPSADKRAACTCTCGFEKSECHAQPPGVFT